MLPASTFPRNARAVLCRTAAVFVLSLICFSSTTRAGVLAGRLYNRYATFFVALLTSTEPQREELMIVAEKSTHLAMFALLGIVLWGALPRGPRRPQLVLAAGAVIGITSELLQRFYVSRDPTVRDAILNVAGTLLGIVLCELVSLTGVRKQESGPPVPADRFVGSEE